MNEREGTLDYKRTWKAQILNERNRKNTVATAGIGENIIRMCVNARAKKAKEKKKQLRKLRSHHDMRLWH